MLIVLFVMVKNHLSCYMTVLHKSNLKSIRQRWHNHVIHRLVNVIWHIFVLFVDSQLRLWWLFHLLWVLIITDHRFMHFIGSACLGHSIMLWIVLFIRCHKSIFSGGSWICGRLFFNLNLIVLADEHQFDIRSNNFLDFMFYFFIFGKWNVGNNSFDSAMNVLYSIVEILLFFF